MKKLMALPLLLLSYNAQAAINLDVQLDFADKSFHKKCVLADQTSSTIFEQDGITVNAMAHVEGGQAVVELQIFKEQNGEQVLMSSPAMKADLGKVAQLTIGDEETISVRMIATK